jgi:hypothetical protein
MRRRLFLATALFCLILVSSSALISTHAAAPDYSGVAVKTGDSAEYSIATTNSSLFGDIDFGVVVFTNVTGVMVTLNITTYNHSSIKNNSMVLAGNVSDSTATVHIGNMTTKMPILYTYLIPANLSANDPIYDGAPLIINETTTMSISGYTRTVNVLNLTVGGLYGISAIAIIYWDRLSGIVVEGDTYLSETGWINDTLRFTSIWMSRQGGIIIPYYMWETLLGIGVIIILVILSGVAWSRIKGQIKGPESQQTNEIAA